MVIPKEVRRQVALHAGQKLMVVAAVVYATVLVEGAALVTSDSDLASLPGVTYLKK